MNKPTQPHVLTPSECDMYNGLYMTTLDQTLYTVVDGGKIELPTSFGPSIVLPILPSKDGVQRFSSKEPVVVPQEENFDVS